MKIKVVVTGAGGRTGKLVLQKLLALTDQFEPLALVRTEKSAKQLKKQVQGLTDDQVAVYDVTKNDARNPLENYDKLVICTSATPKIKIWSIIKLFFLKLIGRGKNVRPEFTFPNGQPYVVDWLGTKQQIDLAKASKSINQVVMVSSMGGTQPENFLNTIGRVPEDDKSGNILLWKRKAEEYLIQSGLAYTIVHPGGLLDKQGGENKVIMDFDDTLLQRKTRTIPRDDVAEVCIQSLTDRNAQFRSFDVITEPYAETEEKKMNWLDFFSKKGNNKY